MMSVIEIDPEYKYSDVKGFIFALRNSTMEDMWLDPRRSCA